MKGRKAQLGLLVSLAVAVTVSGVWVIQAERRARQVFVELEALNRERDRLQADWGRLQLEESAWATHPLIESLAREQLDLRQVDAGEVVLVVEPGP